MSESFQTIDHLFARAIIPHGTSEEQAFVARLFQESRNGRLYLPQLKPLINLENLAQKPTSPIVFEDGCYYLRRNYELKTSVFSHLCCLSQPSTRFSSPPQPPEELYPAQRSAFFTIFSQKLTLISGGPGSGKTHLARSVIDAFTTKFPGAKVIATAPTGKAAYRMKHPLATTKTLHSLLKLKQGETVPQTPHPILCDLLFVDECSMIDLRLFYLLFEAILPTTHVVLMGDPDQLPPIESGAVFADLLTNPSLSHINLNETKRTNLSSLIDLATSIRQGDIDAVTQLFKSGDPALEWRPLPQAPPQIDRQNAIIITPHKKGPLGSDACNNAQPQTDTFPIMITQNDYKLGLMNGDIGLCNKGIVIFDSGENSLSYPLSLLDCYTKAFAISIHKSQGSEFDHVHLLLPPTEHPLTRAMVYTAVTRAKKRLTLYADATLDNISF